MKIFTIIALVSLLVCLISIIAQISITLLGIIVIANSLKTPDRDYVCGMPIVGFIGISFFLFLIMLIIMGVQLYIKVSHKNKLD